MNQMILIWFRRFRPDYGQKFRFHRALSEACSGLAYPVTIQDSSYDSNLLGSFWRRGWFIIPLAMLAFIIGMIIIMLLSLMLLPDNLSKAGWLAGTLILLVLILFLSFKAYKRLGYKSYIDKQTKDKLTHTLESIKAGQINNIMGVDVIQCSDNVWQDLVTTALAKIDIAIIDISELTDNLAWEITQAFKHLPKERIVFVCDEESNRPDLIASLNQLLLTHDIEADSADIRNELFIYPSTQAGVGPGRRRQMVKVVKQLRTIISDRLLPE